MAVVTNFIIIKISAMGDNIMAFPVVNQIKKISPNSRVIWICGNKSYELAKLQKNIDYVYSIDEEKLLRGNKFFQFLEIIKIWLFLFRIKNKNVKILHSDKRYLILYPFFKKDHLFCQVQGVHHSIQYQKLVGLPIINSFEFYTLRYDLLPKIEEKYDVILVPGGAKNTLRTDILRRYPIECYASLYDLLIKKNFKVCLIGGPEDAWVLDYFPKDVNSKIGKFSILETVALIKNSYALITHDTGPMHFGAMVGAKVISLFGPTKKSDKEPLTNPDSISLFEIGDLTCAPCYNDKNYSNSCFDPVCLRNITIEKILEYL